MLFRSAVAKLSGRGLGHTGGTLDKLEAIPGFRTDLPQARFEEQVDAIGLAVAAQSAELVPADGALYALRDATATVPSIPLIATSVMSKKLAVATDLILLDEPFGALDQQTRLLMGDELLRLWRETGATVLLITHSLDEAAMLSDRIGIMSSRPGRFIDIVETGWPRERDSRIASDAAFGTITARLWEKLRSESMKAMAGENRA